MPEADLKEALSRLIVGIWGAELELFFLELNQMGQVYFVLQNHLEHGLSGIHRFSAILGSHGPPLKTCGHVYFAPA